MNSRQVRTKIKSVTNVKKITKALQMVSAIKMRKAQNDAVEGRPYQANLDEIMRQLTAKIDPHFSPLLQKTENAGLKNLILFISTDKGLCGSYNFNLFRYIVKNVDLKNHDFIVVGKKAALFVNKIGGQIVAEFSATNPQNNVSAIFKMVTENFLMKKYRVIKILYNRYISTLKNEPTEEVLLPVSYEAKKENVKVAEKEFLIEPDPKVLIDQLIKSYIEEKIRNCIIQATASEHSSRMIAMKNATDNANDVIYNLTLLRNKIRQEKITNELLDMMSAKESVGN